MFQSDVYEPTNAERRRGEELTKEFKGQLFYVTQIDPRSTEAVDSYYGEPISENHSEIYENNNWRIDEITPSVWGGLELFVVLWDDDGYTLGVYTTEALLRGGREMPRCE